MSAVAKSPASDQFVRDYLGPSADMPPTDKWRSRIRECLLADGIPNVVNAGQQGSPMAAPGKWPWAYAIFHGILTAEEAQPAFAKYCNEQLTWRGLGSGVEPPSTHVPPGAPSGATVVDMQHVVVHQAWLIGSLASDGATRNLARAQAIDLRKLILANKVCDASNMTVINQRENGWPLQALLIDYLASKDMTVAQGANAIHARLMLMRGTEDDVPYYTINLPSLSDPGHGNLPICVWMNGTILRGEAWLSNALTISPELILHGLRCMIHSQVEGGRFVDDYGWGPAAQGEPPFFAGVPQFHDDGKETMDPWVWTGILAAKPVLGDQWTDAHEALLEGCRARYVGLNRFKSSDSGFRDQKNMSIAIECAPTWGMRD